jgi:hypothetical protein
MSTAQIVFSVGFAFVALLIVSFAIYVFATTTWGDRWVRVKKVKTDD